MELFKRNIQASELRYWLYIFIVFLIFIIWLSKLFVLQVLQGDDLANAAQRLTERNIRLNAKRGLIYYNDGQTPVVNNVDFFSVYLTPGMVRGDELSDQLKLLAQILNTDYNRLEQTIGGRQDLMQPILLASDVSLSKISQIAERKDRLHGITYTSHPQRQMVEDGSIIHVVGYVGNISNRELEVLYSDRYPRNTTIGKTGIEQYYDILLRGKDGQRTQVVDAVGNVIQESISPPETGSELTLSIDYRYQKLAEKALGGRPGSAVILRPATGEVLALVSSPWYNLQDFRSVERYQRILEDPRKPLLNRSIGSAYPPASTFKLVTATAQLATKSFSPDEYIFDPGYWVLGNRRFHCWLKTGHGNENLVEAIADSCNVYFGVTGVRYTGQRNILQYANKYGYGRLTGIDLPGEVSGFVPSAEWKWETQKEVWTQGDTLNISIGQGYLLVTPLQVADMVATIVNNGVSYKPFLLKKIDQSDSAASTQQDASSINEPELAFNMNLDSSIFERIKAGMRLAVTGGTARGSMMNGVAEVAAKTGTAEIGLSDNWHSWFAAYAPYDTNDPMQRIVVVTQVEADPRSDAVYDWWAPKAADIIFRGIFANETYEEVWENYQRRRVWFAPLMAVPQKVAEARQLEAESQQPLVHTEQADELGQGSAEGAGN